MNDCLDAQTIAAWMEGSLRGAERAAAEQHAAGCARCQAVLAAMVRTEPAAPVRVPWWRGVPFRWAVPLTAAAAALTVWVVTQPPERVTPSEVSAPAAPQPQVADRRAEEPKPAAEADAQQPTAKAPSAAPLDALSARGKVTGGSRLRADESGRASARQARGAEESGRASARQAREPQAPRDTMPPSVPESAAAAPPAASPTSELPRFRTSAPSAGAAASAGGVVAAQKALVPIEAASPDPSVRWRVGARGLVERSTDSGATWRRITFPEPVDLVALTVTSPDAADVAAADGRVFRTTDGGATWAIRK